MWPPRSSTSRRIAAAVGSVVLLGGATAAVLSATPAQATAAKAASSSEFVRFAADSSIKVYWRGNGHGHGMSQYGARGAALHGLSMAKILAFYYPGTTLTTIDPSQIRVRLSNGTTTDTTVFAGTAGLTLSGYGALPKTGYTHFRLVPSGTGLAVQGQKSGKWHSLKTGLPKRADFSTTAGWVQVLMADGSSTRYHGTVGAVRSGSTEWTINRVALDLYVQGSVPREMPASWSAAAVRAQAVAARSYAEAEMAAAGSGSQYDICDNTMCQMYGGMTHYDSSGHVLWSDDPAALTGNANKVLHYKGAPVFAQYSASNGGATVDGGQPYLVGKTDPYDTAASGDPYLDESTSMRATTLAGAYGLKSVSSLQITKRDGHGPWGGRILTAYVNGTTTAGKSAHIATTGFDLGSATGAYTDYLKFDSEQTVPSAPTKVHATPGDAGATVSWTAPTSTGGLAVSRYRIRYAGHSVTRPASTRSTWIGPLSNVSATTVTVSAINAAGASAPAAVSVTAAPAPRAIVAVSPTQLFSAAADSSHPYRFSVPGHGSIPKSGARSVQLAVTVHSPTKSGVLTIAPSGVNALPLAAVAYRSGHNSTTTVSIPLVPTGTVILRPSAGSMHVSAVQESYTASTGNRVQLTARKTIAKLAKVATGNGTRLALNRLPGVSASTKGVVVAVDSSSSKSTTLRLWSDGAPKANAAQVTVSPYASKTNLLVLPVGAAHALRIAAGKSGVAARVTLLGVLGSSGGLLETVPPSAIIDDASAHHSRAVGATPVSVSVAGGQIPSSGVAAMLMLVTARSTGASGHVWAYPSGAHRIMKPPVLAFAGTGSVTSLALVRVTSARTIMLKSSASGVHVSLAAIGYVTSS
jgi:stage II sporulation protein D